MSNNPENKKLAQSASALGATLFGFGAGAMWGFRLDNTVLISAIFLGALIHLAGMYVIQMQGNVRKSTVLARIVWVTAWVCFIALLGLLIYVFSYRVGVSEELTEIRSTSKHYSSFMVS